MPLGRGCHLDQAMIRSLEFQPLPFSREGKGLKMELVTEAAQAARPPENPEVRASEGFQVSGRIHVLGG